MIKVADAKPRLKVVSAGAPFGTKIYLITEDGSEIDVSKCVRLVKFEHAAGQIPIVTVEVFYSHVELIGEMKAAIAALADVTPVDSEFREYKLA